jgi:cytidyltransferase-like protein
MAETGAGAVKLEGGQHMAETIAFLTARGVPVMAHVGPDAAGGEHAGRLQGGGPGRGGRAGAGRCAGRGAGGGLSVVLEKVPERLAGEITAALAIPTIGIGASAPATGRCWWSMTCWACSPSSAPSSSSAMPSLADRRMRRSPPMPPRCARGAFRGPEHVFPDEAPGASVTGIVRTVADLRARGAQWKAEGAVVGVVPTMGALHEGHLSLVRAAQNQCDRVIVTIFVNPRQFNNPEDLAKYPRTEEADAALLRPLGWTCRLCPAPGRGLSAGLCHHRQRGGMSEPLEGSTGPAISTGWRRWWPSCSG